MKFIDTGVIINTVEISSHIKEKKMKNFKKIVLALCVLAVLCASVAVVALAETTYTGTMAAYTTKVNAVETAATTNDKYFAAVAAADYIAATPVDPASEGYAELKAKLDAAVLATMNALVAELPAEYTADANGYYPTVSTNVIIGKINRLGKLHPDVAALADYAAFSTAFAEAKAKYDAAFEANKDMAERKASIDEYDLAIDMNFDMDSKTPTSNKWGIGNKQSNYADTEIGKDGTNKYYTVRYKSEYHTYIDLKLGDSTKGMVFEFDFTSFGNLPATGITFEAGEDGASGARTFPKFFEITSSGTLNVFLGGQVVKSIPEFFVPGEWTHIAMTFDAVTLETNLYINYEYVATGNGVTGDPYTLTRPRFGKKNSTGEFSVDNVMIYQGNAVRTHGKLAAMTDDEKIVYYANYLADEDRSIASRSTAYNFATDLVPSYYNAATQEFKTENPDIIAAINTYLSFDYDTLLNALKQTNLEKLVALVADIKDLARTPSTLSARTSGLDIVDQFLSANAGQIADGPVYEEYFGICNAIRANIEAENLINSFIASMDRFAKATTITSIQKHYNNAKALFDQGLEMELLEDPNYASFAAAKTAFDLAGETVKKAIRDNNSKAIVSCVEFIAEYDTEEEWVANFAFVEKYVNLIREKVYEDNYSLDYPGIDDALEFYNMVNDYFFGLLQAEHIAIISEQLDKFTKTEAYIEKLGICSFITRYVDSREGTINNVDYANNEELQVLLNTHKTYLGELEVQERDYGALLDQNTIYFINLVNKLTTCTSYTTMKATFDEATVYYYAMNVGGADAKAAIAIYEEYEDALAIMEASSAAFVEQVLLLGTVFDDEELYQALVACTYYAQFADEEIAGVAEAMATYKAAYDEYVGAIDAANSDLAEAGVAVGSVRTCSGVAPIIAVIIKLIFG